MRREKSTQTGSALGEGTAGLTGARVLLLIPARTYRATAFLQAATRLGIDIVIGSDGALPVDGQSVIHVDLGDLEGSVGRLVERSGAIDAVIAADTPMLALAAATSSRMSLHTNSVAAVTAATNKAIQRFLWDRSGVPQPGFRIIPARASQTAMERVAGEVGFPCVVKAISLSASQGILRANDSTAAVHAAAHIRSILGRAGQAASEPLLIEQYLSGAEISIDGFLTDEGLTVTAVFDKPDCAEGPTFEERMLITPSQLDASTMQMAVRTAADAARALGLERGPIHAELRLGDGDGGTVPRMLELAARSIGGLCSRALRYLDGVSLEEMVFANALGRSRTMRYVGPPSGVLMIPVEQAGTLRAVGGKTAALGVPGITGISITAHVGQAVRPLPDGDQYLGFIFAEAGTHAEVETALRAARQRLRVEVEAPAGAA